MNLPTFSTLLLFYIWWLSVNGFIYYSEFNFLLCFLDTPLHAKRFMILYISINCAFTFFAVYFQLFGFLREMLHFLFLCIFSLIFLKCKLIRVIAPATIIFALSTFTEGISATLMRLLVTKIASPALGNAVQMVLTAALAFLFYAALRVIGKRYAFATKQVISSYLYILLPCAFVVWIIRYGLGLDSSNLFLNRPPFTESPHLWAFACIVGALVAFFIILEVFEKTSLLSVREMEKALLDDQLREQSIYLAEAKKRDEQYRSFQHDINNHLLVLSGLIQEKKYTEAEQYFNKRYISNNTLLFHISTGNPVLDVLLKEKISYARQNNITVAYTIKIPKNMSIDDIDLCIVLTNALDNAIQACLQENPGNRKIAIDIKVRHQFLLIEVTNSSHSLALPKLGTGLNNIKHTAEKYQGTLQVGTSNGFFRLSVLLCWNQKVIPPFTKLD